MRIIDYFTFLLQSLFAIGKSLKGQRTKNKLVCNTLTHKAGKGYPIVVISTFLQSLKKLLHFEEYLKKYTNYCAHVFVKSILIILIT